MIAPKAIIKHLLGILLSFSMSTCAFALKTDDQTCEKSKIEARTDLKNNKVCFILQGGIAPVYRVGQEVFEKKYKVSYFDLGCLMPSNLFIEHYNAEVAKHLDQKYGKRWRKEVRNDVKGVRR